jgi:DNA-binding beta-propeller fold protein YncE
MNRPFQYDAFLCYSSQDRQRVRALAERLRDNGVRIWFDDWEIKLGDDILLKIEQGLESSCTLILLMSSHAFGSDWVAMERNTTMFRDPVNKQRRFIPLLLEDCDIPDTIKRFRYIDWRSEDEQEYGKLLSAIAPMKETTGEVAGSSVPYKLKEVPPITIESKTEILSSKQVRNVTRARHGENILWQLFSFPDGGSPQRLLYANGTLLVSNWGSSNIMFLSPTERTVIGVTELDSYEAGDLALPSERSKFGEASVIRRYPPGDMAVAKGRLFVGQVFSEFLVVIDLNSRVIVKRIPVGGEGSLVTSPDERNVYFASNKRNEFYIIDSDTYQFEAITYPGSGRGIGSIFIHPNSKTLYLGIQRGGSTNGRTLQGGNSFIAVYDLLAKEYIADIYLAEIEGDVSDDSWPVCMTYAIDEKLIYVGMIQSRKGIYFISDDTNRIIGNIAFEPNSMNKHFGWVDPLSQAIYGGFLLSVNRNNYELAVIDRSSKQLLASIPLGGSGNGPNHILVVDNEAVICHSEYDGLLFVDLIAITQGLLKKRPVNQG